MKSVLMEGFDKPIPVGNIFCIGRNYAAHAAELGNAVEETPLVFLKPTSALSLEDTPILLPSFSNEVHYETELVVLIGKDGKNICRENALDYVLGYGIGLDLTARDIQTQAKSKGHPWTLAKGFDQAACVSRFIDAKALPNPNQCRFTMKQNNQIKQEGNTALMLFDIPHLIAYLSKMFTLSAGDLIFTGTPEGVERVNPGDILNLKLADQISARFVVQA